MCEVTTESIDTDASTERNATVLEQQFPRFILSESFIAIPHRERVCVCVRARASASDGIPEKSFIVPCGACVERAASRRLVEFAIKKIDAMEGISLEANLLLFHSAPGLSSLIRYSLESTLFHR